MARDRKRAKQRRARQTSSTRPKAASRRARPLDAEQRSTVEPPEPSGEASGDAELAKEAIRGAPTDEVDHPVDDPDAGAEVYEDELTDEAGDGVLSDLVDRDADLGLEDEPVEDSDGAEAGAVAARPRRREPARRKQGNRVFAFLRACWAELQRVQWPDRRAVGQATAVVLGFVIVAGSYLGLMDFIWQKVVTALLNL